MSIPRSFTASTLVALVSASWLLGCAPREPEAHNLVLVSVDTLRADHLGAYGAPEGFTPALDALAGESLVFERAFAPASQTMPSVAAMLTGREPEEVGVISNRTVLTPAVPTLATLLWGANHATAAVVSNAVLHPRAGLSAGFDVYDARLMDLERNRPYPERFAKGTTDAALARLDEIRGGAAGPFFLWVHYQDPHGPYTPPSSYAEPAGPRPSLPATNAQPPLGRDQSGVGQIPQYQARDGVRDPERYRAAYAGEVRYVDTEIGRLLAGLRERGLWDRTAVLFTADHGEGLGEDDYWFAHGEYLSQPLVHVPLLLRVPGAPPGRSRALAGLVDVAPTLLALAALAAPPDAVGRDLRAPAPDGRRLYLNALGGSLVPRLAVIEGDWQYRMSQMEGVRHESLYRFGDTRDLAGEEPGRLALLREALRVRRASLRTEEAPRLRELPPEERALLRALGYVFDED